MKRNVIALGILAVLLPLTSPAAAQLQETVFYPKGNVDTVAERAWTRVVGDGAGVEVFRRWEDGGPFQSRGHLALRGPVQDIVIHPYLPYAFVSTWNGFVQAIDLSIGNLRVLDDLFVDFLVQDIEIVGNWLLASAPASSEIWRIDIQAPEFLRESGVVTGVEAQSIVQDVDPGFAWIQEVASVRLLSVESLAMAEPLTAPASGGVHPIDASYVLAAGTIRSRSNMDVVATFDVPAGVKTAAVDRENMIGYVLDNANVLHRISFEDPAHPRILNQLQLSLEGGFTAQIAFDGDQVAVASGGVEEIDFSALAPEQKLVRVSSHIKAVEAYHGRIFTALLTGGGAILDPRIAGPTRMVLDQFFGANLVDLVVGRRPETVDRGARRIPAAPSDALPRRDPVYAAAGADGLVVLEVGIDGMEERMRVPLGNATDVHLDGDRLFVVDGSDGVHIFDLADPWTPTEIGHFSTLNASGCATSGDVLYVANGLPTDLIVDISDPTQPAQIGTFAGTRLLAVEGDRLYVPEDWAFRAYDISDPANPVSLGYNLDVLFTKGITPVPSADAPAGQRQAWVAMGFDGVDLLDLTDPQNPVRLDHFATRDIATDVAVDGNTIVVADGMAGISVLERTVPGAARDAGATDASTVAPAGASGLRLANTPNPVRDRTDISFTLGAPQPVRLDVFDVAGRLVTTLLDRPMGAGSHSVAWNRRDDRGRRVAAGALFYRLVTPERTATGKMILVR